MLKAITFQVFSLLIYFIFLGIGIKKKYTVVKHVSIFMFYIYLVGLISITIFPIPVQKTLIEAMRENNFIRHSFTPLASIMGIIKTGGLRTILTQLGGNILLFAPVGFLIPIFFKRVSNFKRAMMVGLMFSLGVEGTQFFLSMILGTIYRSVDVDDIILNTIGACLGFLVLKLSMDVSSNFLDLSHLKNQAA